MDKSLITHGNVDYNISVQRIVDKLYIDKVKQESDDHYEGYYITYFVERCDCFDHDCLKRYITLNLPGSRRSRLAICSTFLNLIMHNRTHQSKFDQYKSPWRYKDKRDSGGWDDGPRYSSVNRGINSKRIRMYQDFLERIIIKIIEQAPLVDTELLFPGLQDPVSGKLVNKQSQWPNGNTNDVVNRIFSWTVCHKPSIVLYFDTVDVAAALCKHSKYWNQTFFYKEFGQFLINGLESVAHKTYVTKYRQLLTKLKNYRNDGYVKWENYGKTTLDMLDIFSDFIGINAGIVVKKEKERQEKIYKEKMPVELRGEPL